MHKKLWFVLSSLFFLCGAADSASSTQSIPPEVTSVISENASMLTLAGVILVIIPILAIAGTALWVVKLCKKLKD